MPNIPPLAWDGDYDKMPHDPARGEEYSDNREAGILNYGGPYMTGISSNISSSY